MTDDGDEYQYFKDSFQDEYDRFQEGDEVEFELLGGEPINMRLAEVDDEEV